MININQELAKLYPAHYKKPFDYSGVGYVGSLNPAVAGGWTYEDDFSSNNWAKTGTANQVGTNVFDWEGIRDNSIHNSTLDLQVHGDGNADDTAWVLRFKCAIQNQSASNNLGDVIYFGLSSAIHSVGGQEAQDHIGIATFYSTTNKTWNAIEGDGEHILTNITTFAHVPAIETVYAEVIRPTATTFTTELFDAVTFDPADTIEKESPSCESTTIDLRYIKIMNWDDGSAPNQQDGILDDLQYANGVTVAP